MWGFSRLFYTESILDLVISRLHFLAIRTIFSNNIYCRSSSICNRLVNTVLQHQRASACQGGSFSSIILSVSLTRSLAQSSQYSKPCIVSFGRRLNISSAPGEYPLPEYDVLTPRELDNEPFISLGSDHMTYQQTRQAFAEAGARWRVVIETQLFWTAARLTQKGCGISILDPFTAAEYARLGLAIRPFSPTIEFKIGVLYPVEHPRSLLTEEFSKLIRKRLHDVTHNAT